MYGLQFALHLKASGSVCSGVGGKWRKREECSLSKNGKQCARGAFLKCSSLDSVSWAAGENRRREEEEAKEGGVNDDHLGIFIRFMCFEMLPATWANPTKDYLHHSTTNLT